MPRVRSQLASPDEPLKDIMLSGQRNLMSNSGFSSIEVLGAKEILGKARNEMSPGSI